MSTNRRVGNWIVIAIAAVLWALLWAFGVVDASTAIAFAVGNGIGIAIANVLWRRSQRKLDEWDRQIERRPDEHHSSDARQRRVRPGRDRRAERTD